MYILSALVLASAAFAQSYPSYCGTCQSYGISPQDGSDYYVSSNSQANFTAVEQFSGCQADSAHNILTDPSGNQYECDQTPMTPDNSTVTTTCPITQGSMVAGTWGLIVISNNGACRPIDYIREFDIVVQAGGYSVRDTRTRELRWRNVFARSKTPDRVNDVTKITIPLAGIDLAQVARLEAEALEILHLL